MTVLVRYFGSIAEVTGLSEEKIQLSEGRLSTLKSTCLDKYPGISELTFQLAVNHSLDTNETLSEGDEIAFLPPFAGG